MMITDEAVEAAAKVLYEIGTEESFAEADPEDIAHMTAWAASVLAAAAPHMMARALEEAADGWSDWDAMEAPEDWLRARAATVRGEQ